MRSLRRVFLPDKGPIIFCTLLLVTIFGLLMVRLYFLQVLRYDEYCSIKQDQNVVVRKIEPERGEIYDRNGKELAVSIEVPSVGVDSNMISGLYTEQELANNLGIELAEVLDMDESLVLRRIKSGRKFIWLKRQVDENIAKRIRDLDIKGVVFKKEGKRFYPLGKLASQVMGFVNIDHEGSEGIERFLNKDFHGEMIQMVGERDGKGRFILKDDKAYKNPPKGNSIFLTIDSKIQYFVERELEQVCKKYNAKGGTIIVQETSTGEILAMANWPTFDPNNITEETQGFIKNRAVTDVYEPGSTFKIITAAAALEEGLVTREDKIFCEEGRYVFAGKPIRDHEKQGWLTFKEVIEKSSNIGVAKVSEKLGKEKMFSYVTNFGFGSKTKIQLPFEADGFLKNPRNWSKISLSRISFGQEISVTPLQMVSAVSAVGNRGKLMHPYIIKFRKDKKGNIIEEFSPQLRRRVISENTALILNDILKGVVENGTGKAAAVEGYAVAGKTGTAQKYDPEIGTYSPDKHVSSFVGYLPADNPRVTILVIVDEPQEIHWGSAVCAPAFASIAKEIMRYLNISPELDLVMAK
ncbi:MAG: penicillin-binding transpeptidase domain-containing protein [bacterium]